MSRPHEMRLFDRDDEVDRVRPAPRDQVTEFLQAGLGQVTVALGGELLDIRFNERALRAMRPEVVGEYLAAGINKADEAAMAARARAERGR